MCHEVGKRKEASRELPIQSSYKLLMAHFSPFLFLKKSQQGCYPSPSPSPWWESYISITQDGTKRDPDAQSRPVRWDRGRMEQVQGWRRRWTMLFCLPRILPSLLLIRAPWFSFWDCLFRTFSPQSWNESYPLTHQVLGPRPAQSIPPATMTGSGMDIRNKSAQWKSSGTSAPTIR